MVFTESYSLFHFEFFGGRRKVVQKAISLNNKFVLPGMIHRSEFQPADIMKYVKEVGALDPKVKGRHGNQTFIDFPSNDRVAVTLDIK